MITAKRSISLGALVFTLTMAAPTSFAAGGGQQVIPGAVEQSLRPASTLPAPEATPVGTLPPATSLVLVSTNAVGGVTPGAVEQSLRPAPTLPATEAAPAVTLPTAPPRAPVSTSADERRVKVDHFVITGNTVFTEAELNAVLADLVGDELTLTEMYGAADRLTDYYQKRGYSLTTVTVPAQRLRDGALRLEVVEGRINKLVFTGNRSYTESTLRAQVAPIAPQTIIRLDELEREVLLLNDLPGLMARSTIVPGAAYGTSDIQFKVEEKPVAASATLDNYGPKIIGQWRLGADFIINNPGKYGDALSLGYTHSESGLLRQGRVGYSLPVDHDGTRLALNYSRAEYDVRDDSGLPKINGASETARIQLSHPLIRSRSRNLVWTAGLARVVGQADTLDIPIVNDEVNFMEAGLTYTSRNVSGGWGSLAGVFSTNFRNNSEGTDGSALPPTLKVNASYEYLLGRGWSAAVLGEALISAEALPDSNRYYLGGPQNIRGFVSSTLSGDDGGAATVELRRALRLNQADLLLRGFIDAGIVDGSGSQNAASDSNTLASAGVAAHVQLRNRYGVDIVWARPIDGKDAGEGHAARVWMALTAAY